MIIIGPGSGLADLFGQVRTGLSAAFASIGWAEDEITLAVARHPEAVDDFYHAFAVLRPRDVGPGMGPEFIYRGHVRELLDRVAAGEDLRPATTAEICLACSEISLRTPMHGAAAGLYLRMWVHAFPGQPITDSQPDDQIHYERLYGSRIDELEALMRRTLSDPDRRLGDIDCTGRHHGQPVTCRYARNTG